MQQPMKPRVYWIRLTHQLEALRILVDLEIDPTKDFNQLDRHELERLVDNVEETGYFVPEQCDRAHYFYEQLQRRSRAFHDLEPDPCSPAVTAKNLRGEVR